MSFAEGYNDAMRSFLDGVQEALTDVGWASPNDSQIIGWTARRYGVDLAKSVALVFSEDTEFAACVRRSLVREMSR